MTNEGYWLDPKTQQLWRVDRHENWVLDQTNATRAGIPKAVYDRLRTLNPATDVDEIRLAAIHAGLVRIRGYRNRIAVQFSASPTRVRETLWSVFMAIDELEAWKDTPLTLDNLAAKDSIEISLSELGKRLKADEPVLREASHRPGITEPDAATIHDVPLGAELSSETLKAFSQED